MTRFALVHAKAAEMRSRMKQPGTVDLSRAIPLEELPEGEMRSAGRPSLEEKNDE